MFCTPGQTSLIQTVPVQVAGIPFSGKRSTWLKITDKSRKLTTRSRATVTTTTHGEGKSQAAAGFAGHQRVERGTTGGEWPRWVLGVACYGVSTGARAVRDEFPKQLCCTYHYGRKCNNNYIPISIPQRTLYVPP